MVEVNLWSALRRHTDGAGVVTVEAGNVGQLLRALSAAYPGLEAVIQTGVSVVIDGQMAAGRHTVIPAGAEVYLMQRVTGG